MKKQTVILAFAFSILGMKPSPADERKEVDPEQFLITGEFRPRAEFRDGYGSLASPDKSPAFFVSQRSRLNFFYSKNNYSALFSLQDIRIWGEDEPRDYNGMISTFEAWAELPITDNLFVKAGRQTLMYDNQRLFAQNDWRQNAGSHDALKLRFKNEQTEADLAFAFNQNKDNLFGTNYFSDELKENYKLLLLSWLSHRFNDNFKLSLINSGDGFQEKEHSEVIKMRYTNGGRIEYTNEPVYLTLNGFYQHGRTREDKPISAFYLQPEFRYSGLNSLNIRLGGEYLSGQNPSDSKSFNSFVPLYGVAHRFNGFMDQFTRFPRDTSSQGLVNPYLFLQYDFTKQWRLKTDFHLFFSQNEILDGEKRANGRYLGYENDFLLTFQVNKELNIDLGYSFLLPTKALGVVKGVQNPDSVQQWSYLMLTYKPEIFSLKK